MPSPPPRAQAKITSFADAAFPLEKFRFRLERLAFDVLAAALPRLPRMACVRLAQACGELAFWLDRRGRKVAEENLRAVFGETLSRERSREIARGSYRNFVRTMFDLFWAQNLTPTNFDRYIKIENRAYLESYLRRLPGGAIFLCAHQGNFEWANLAFGFLGFQVTVVAENFKNALLDEVFQRLRQVSGQTLIAQDGAMLRLLRTVKRGGYSGMLIDLNLRPSQAATVIEGFGLKMCVTYLHAFLAQRAGTLIVPVETEPLADGTCRVLPLPAIEWPAGASVQEISQRCWDAFEPGLRARPELWLWPYKHFRFRPKNATRAYPAYAHESGKFEKLLREIQSAKPPIAPSLPSAATDAAREGI